MKPLDTYTTVLVVWFMNNFMNNFDPYFKTFMLDQKYERKGEN